MRKSSSQVTFEHFYINMLWDTKFLMRIEKAHSVVKSPDEKRNVFEAYVFSVCANWEILIEDLLIDCFNKDTSAYRKFTGFEISKNLSRETCKAIILGIGYLDFKSISDLRSRANNILVPHCNPFKIIPRKNETKIDEFYKIRNYLAHYSDYAKRALEKIYRDRYGLRTFRQPGEFLLAKDRKQDIPRMGVYINNFIDTANIMAKSLGIAVPLSLIA